MIHVLAIITTKPGLRDTVLQAARTLTQRLGGRVPTEAQE